MKASESLSTTNQVQGSQQTPRLVTGANGFIGSHVVRALLERGHEVRALVRPSSNLTNLEGLDLERVQGDVRDARAVRRAVRGCRWVFHVAALYAFWVRPRRLIYEVNVEGTRHVLEAALAEGVERLVHTSSVAALGLRADGRPADETTPLDPDHLISDYKRSKYQAQRLVLRYVRERDLPAVVVNPSLPLGPGDYKPTPSGRIVVDFLNRRFPAYMDTGLNAVDVEDVGRGHVLAAERGRVGQCYILGGENLTLKELLEKLAALSGLPAPRVRLPYAPVLALSYLNAAWCALSRRTPRMTPETVRLARQRAFYSPAKAVRELGFPRTPARVALEKAIEWYVSHGYVEKPLPARR